MGIANVQLYDHSYASDIGFALRKPFQELMPIMGALLNEQEIEADESLEKRIERKVLHILNMAVIRGAAVLWHIGRWIVHLSDTQLDEEGLHLVPLDEGEISKVILEEEKKLYQKKLDNNLVFWAWAWITRKKDDCPSVEDIITLISEQFQKAFPDVQNNIPKMAQKAYKDKDFWFIRLMSAFVHVSEEALV